MHIRTALAVVAGLGLAGLASAQANKGILSGEAPSPVPMGSTVPLRIEATAPMSLASACPDEVRFNSPTGPLVWQPTFCILPFITVGPGRPYNQMAWDGTNNQSRPGPASPGTYYIRFRGTDANTSNPFSVRWVPVRIDPVSGPTLPVLKVGAVTRGATTPLGISDPLNANAPYWIAASFGTNTGQPLGAPVGHLALDFDPLFFVTLNNLSGLTTGFQGTLSGGSASASIQIPNLALLQGAQIAFQGAVTGSLVLTNPVQKIIG